MNIASKTMLGGKTVKNRLVMAPLYMHCFKGGHDDEFDQRYVEHYASRAKGGAGIVITESIYAYGAATNSKLWNPVNQEVFSQIAEQCHRYDALAMMQISLGKKIPDVTALSAAEIHALQNDLMYAALHAHKLGFDGVEFHCAHGGVMAVLFDADSNTRTDAFGGSASGRTRVLTDIIPKIKANTAKDFVVMVRMGALLPTIHEGVACAKALIKAGADALDITYGMSQPTDLDAVLPGFSPMVATGSKLRAMVPVPVMVGGNILTAQQAETLIEQDCADFVAIGRAMLADPNFAQHVLTKTPLNGCLNCKRCQWYDHDPHCPAKIKRNHPGCK